jgi:hypothetical protein
VHGTPVVTKDAAVEGAANRLTQLMARQESGSNASDLHGAPPPSRKWLLPFKECGDDLLPFFRP